jgi:hypothetical protein
MRFTMQKDWIGIFTVLIIGIVIGFSLETIAMKSRNQYNSWSDSSWWPEDGKRRSVSMGGKTYFGNEAEFLAGYPGYICVYRDDDVLMLKGDVISSRKQFKE